MFGLSSKEEATLLKYPSHATALAILKFALRSNGATSEEFMIGLQISQGRFHPRFNELVASGCLVVVGRRRTKSKRFAKVYRPAKDATFARYLAYSKARRAVRVVQSNAKVLDTLSDVDRMVLHAGRTALRSWTGGNAKRRSALVVFVARMNEISKLAQKGTKEQA